MNFPAYEQWIIRQVVLGLPDSVEEYESERELFADIYTTGAR